MLDMICSCPSLLICCTEICHVVCSALQSCPSRHGKLHLQDACPCLLHLNLSAGVLSATCSFLSVKKISEPTNHCKLLSIQLLIRRACCLQIPGWCTCVLCTATCCVSCIADSRLPPCHHKMRPLVTHVWLPVHPHPLRACELHLCMPLSWCLPCTDLCACWQFIWASAV